MATYEMYRPVNKAGTGVWVWATSEGEAAQVFVAAGRARSLDGVVRCRLDTVTASMFGRPPRRRDSFRVVDSSTGADLGPLADLERTGTMSWAMDPDDPHWVLTPVDVDGEGEGTDRGCGTCHPPEPGSADAAAIDTFALFLREAGRAGVDPRGPLPDTAEARAFARRWGPYVSGEADGPTGTAP